LRTASPDTFITHLPIVLPNAQASDLPNLLTATDIDGGFTADSSVEAQGRKDVMIWAVNKILDTKGNCNEVMNYYGT